MQVTSTNSTFVQALDATPGSSASAAAQNTLSQNDFLKLLVAQMTAQDPMNPESNTDFAAQMAQFSALQASQGTEAQMQQMVTAQQTQQANELLGRSVTLQNADSTVTTGTVTGVAVGSGTPYLMVNGGLYGLSQVLTVAPAVTTGN